VSAVVADTMLLRSLESPSSVRRLTMRRSRPSLRSSLFMPNDEASGPDLVAWTAPSGPSGPTGEGSIPSGEEGDSTTPGSGLRGRARSLSLTLGELFSGSRGSRRRRDSEEADDGSSGLLAAAPISRSTEAL
jgi:hypothetical protein